MRTFFRHIKQYRQLFLSTLFFALFSFSITIFAAPFAPGATLSPSCVPGSGVDCTVAPFAVGTTISSATAGSILFAGAAGIMAQDNTNLFWDDTSNFLGIGTATPTTTLNIVGSGLSTAFPLTISNSGYHAGIKLIGTYDGVDTRSMVTGSRARGTIAVPTALLADDTIFSLDAQPYIDGSYRSAGDIKFHVGASPGVGSYPTYIAFRTVNTGETTRTERMRISESGNIGIGTATPGTSRFKVVSEAESSAGETMASFGVSDDASSLLHIGNGTSLDSSYIPMIKAINSGSTAALSVIGQGTTDTGTTPIMSFQSRIGSGSLSATRPLFGWSNFGTRVMTMSADGHLGLNTETPGTPPFNTLAGNNKILDVVSTIRTTGTSTISPRFHLLDQKTNGALTGEIQFYKDLGGAIVDSSTYFGNIIARGWDGAAYQTGSEIRFGVNGTPGSGSIPGKIEFFTTPSGSTTGLERFEIASSGNVTVASADLGDGDSISGPVLTIGRNTNTDTAAGAINLLQKDGTAGYVWQDDAGILRIYTAAPTNGAGDTAGTAVGSFASVRSTKQDISDFTDTASALSMVVNAPLHKYRYINEVEGYGTNNPLAKHRLGFIADEVDPLFMWGNSIDQVSVNGLLMGAIQELDIKIQNISGLSSGSGSVADFLANQADKFINGIVRVARLVVGSSSARTGITLYDEVTGEPYCLSIANGATKTVSGECSVIVPAPVSVPTPSEPLPETDASTSEETSETPSEPESAVVPASETPDAPIEEPVPAPEPEPTPPPVEEPPAPEPAPAE